MNRRTILAGSVTTLGMLAGCAGQSSNERFAHTVSVYLSERDETHDVTVLIQNDQQETLFEQEYQLSNTNEAEEDATFPASTEPSTVVITVDGARFDYQWPGIETAELPCEDSNHAGIEVYVGSDTDGSPDVRLGANCQSVTIKNESE